jgi:hypothetical protein
MMMNIYFVLVLQEDTVQVIWLLGPEGSDGQVPTNYAKSGSKPLRLLQPVGKPQVPLKSWDVRLNNVSVTYRYKTTRRPRFTKITNTADVIGGKPIAV